MVFVKQVTFLAAVTALATACAGGTPAPETALDHKPALEIPDETATAVDAPLDDATQPAPLARKAVEKDIPEPEPRFTTEGLTLTAADAWLGAPDLLRVEKQGHIRRYAGRNCQLYIVVYNDRIDHIEAWNTDSGRVMNADECGQGLADLAAR